MGWIDIVIQILNFFVDVILPLLAEIL